MLSNFQKLGDQDLCNQCYHLCRTLSGGDESDVDGKELAVEVMCDDMAADKKHLEELYPNLLVACTLPVTVASAERSFLKLIKTY